MGHDECAESTLCKRQQVGQVFVQFGSLGDQQHGIVTTQPLQG